MVHSLHKANILNEQFNQLLPQLQVTCESLQGGSQSMVEATKQLRQTRLEVMKDRQLSSKIATSLQERLTADASLTNSCQTFASGLETALNNWNRNVERLDLLSSATIDAMRSAIQEDEQTLAIRAKTATEALDNLRHQLQDDLGTAVEQQREAITALGAPARSALELSQGLVARLEALQDSLGRLVGPASTPGSPLDRVNREDISTSFTSSIDP
jgi:chromosome segregation ATPase